MDDIDRTINHARDLIRRLEEFYEWKPSLDGPMPVDVLWTRDLMDYEYMTGVSMLWMKNGRVLKGFVVRSKVEDVESWDALAKLCLDRFWRYLGAD